MQGFGTLPDGVTPNDFLTGIDYGGYQQSGLGNNGNDYWTEFVGDGTSNGWNWGDGISVDNLTNGTDAGFVWTAANPGNPNFDIVPEPAIGAFMAMSLLLIRRRSRRI